MKLFTNWETIKIMPQLDKTGPMGQGSQTGRRQGKCSSPDNETVEFTQRGRGMRCGFRNRVNDNNENTSVFGRGHGRGRNTGKGRGLGMGEGPNSQMKQQFKTAINKYKHE